MLTPNTHFEQISLTIVRKMIEEQLRKETTAKQDQKVKNKSLEEDLFERQKQAVTRQRAVSTVES
jgi:hypothetical protein